MYDTITYQKVTNIIVGQLCWPGPELIRQIEHVHAIHLRSRLEAAFAPFCKTLQLKNSSPDSKKWSDFLSFPFSVADDDEADFWLQGWSAQFRLKGSSIFYLSSLGHHGISLVYNVQIEDPWDRWMLLWPTLVLFSFKIWLMVQDITKAWYRSWNVVSLWRGLMITF